MPKLDLELEEVSVLLKKLEYPPVHQELSQAELVFLAGVKQKLEGADPRRMCEVTFCCTASEIATIIHGLGLLLDDTAFNWRKLPQSVVVLRLQESFKHALSERKT
jgi:hypothetical protein